MRLMTSQLESLVRACTVQVIGEERGTGFFVAPGIVITCAHVTGSRRPPAVRWHRDGQRAVEVTAPGPARTLHHAEGPIPALDRLYPDIAVIEVPALTDHPCVAVDDDWPQDLDTFYVCGYPREGGAELLTPVRLSYRGKHATDPVAYIDLAEDTIKPGMSGAALVNLRTRQCAECWWRPSIQGSRTGGWPSTGRQCKATSKDRWRPTARFTGKTSAGMPLSVSARRTGGRPTSPARCRRTSSPGMICSPRPRTRCGPPARVAGRASSASSAWAEPASRCSPVRLPTMPR